MSPIRTVEDGVNDTIARLGADGFVAYPTETVWGLGACADRPRAVDRLMDWKGRDSGSPLAVLVPGPIAAEAMGCELRGPIRQLMDAFWPGPLMIVVACRKEWAPGVARADGALGLRCSSHRLATALARGLLEAGLGPLTSTSLNQPGKPPARNVAEAIRLTGPVPTDASTTAIEGPLLISTSGGDAGGARPSTVVDCTASEFSILRDGAIARDLSQKVWSA